MILVTWESLPLVLLAILTAVIGVARLVRAIVYDDFPPSVWWRGTWLRWTEGTGWEALFTCWWCLSFWVALACVGWWIAGLFVAWIAWAWWVFWGALALAYLAPMLIVRDGQD